MKEDLIGEQVVLTGPREQVSRLLVGATRAFLEAAEITDYDSGKLDEELRDAVDGIDDSDHGHVEARLCVTADGLEVRLGPESDPAALRTVACVR